MAKAAKTSRKTPKRVPAHGRGQLNVGNPGNAGGSGRPPSAIREQLRGSFAERARIIDAIADGEPMQRIDVPLLSVLQYAHCPKCGDALKPNPDIEAADLLLISMSGKVSASPRDRLAALDLQAKYGLGTLKEVSVENVRERVQATLDVIRSHASPEQAASIIAALRPVWA